MVTWWLVVSIMIGGGNWRPMEDTRMASREACEAAASERLDYIDNGHMVGADGKELNEEYEVAVACMKHHSKTDPA